MRVAIYDDHGRLLWQGTVRPADGSMRTAVAEAHARHRQELSTEQSEKTRVLRRDTTGTPG